MTRRRDLPVSELRVTTNSIRILEKMRDHKANIYADDEGIGLCVEPYRKISHKALASLRAQRFIRPHEDDPHTFFLTRRALELLEIDPRTRRKGHGNE